VKPGLTGLAQVRGYRGDSSDQYLLDKRIEADLYYVENASVLLDLQILIETGWWWITGRGGAQKPGRSPQ
jgi:lipopolysaccharide/colanic/teichoic acid biosynthesis glycosyltransferase